MLCLGEAFEIFVVDVGVPEEPLLVCDLKDPLNQPLAPMYQLVMFKIVHMVLTVDIE